MISLYEYTGKPDENGTGLKVNAYARIKKQPFKQRELNLKNYTGKVFLYTKEFLDEYFKLNEMLSLYDYLDKPSGMKLGGEVCKEAVTSQERIEEREVSTPNYKGNVHLYRREFLDKYFNSKQVTKS
tara:strand:- start:344 stop:724 length:381 start_codon:yes stop_codon:yes gene_type:complete